MFIHNLWYTYHLLGQAKLTFLAGQPKNVWKAIHYLGLAIV